jgi:hypothetical protein
VPLLHLLKCLDPEVLLAMQRFRFQGQRPCYEHGMNTNHLSVLAHPGQHLYPQQTRQSLNPSSSPRYLNPSVKLVTLYLHSITFCLRVLIPNAHYFCAITIYPFSMYIYTSQLVYFTTSVCLQSHCAHNYPRFTFFSTLFHVQVLSRSPNQQQ